LRKNAQIIKWPKNPSSGSGVAPCGLAGGGTDKRTWRS